jgi:LCP family protein required for cell wall assembly
MSDTSDISVGASSASAAGTADNTEPPRRKRRRMRIVLISAGSFLVLVIAAVVGTLLYVNNEVSSIPRIKVNHLAPGSQTFLITGAANASSPSLSNLVMLLHIDADGAAGGVVTIPGNVSVDVPGQGVKPLWDAFETGGPSLLVQTIEHVTGLSINHYARIDFSEVSGLVNAIGGVDVTVPVANSSDGYQFVQGVNQLNGTTVIYYAHDTKISSQDRLLRQEILVRAILSKIANDHLITNPLTAARVLNSLKSMLTLDSNLTNTDVVSLAGKFGNASTGGAVYVTAATQTAKRGQIVLNASIDDQLWIAVKNGSIATFAKAHSSTVTPVITH